MEQKQACMQATRLGYYEGVREIVQCGRLLFYRSTGTSPSDSGLTLDDRSREGTFFPFYGLT